MAYDTMKSERETGGRGTSARDVRTAMSYINVASNVLLLPNKFYVLIFFSRYLKGVGGGAGGGRRRIEYIYRGGLKRDGEEETRRLVLFIDTKHPKKAVYC